MTKSIEFSRIDGSVVAPSSKSVAQRAIVAALLSQGTTVLQHLTLCNDTKAALQIAETLSAAIVSDGTTYNITSHFVDKKTTPQTIFCGESGLLVRMISPVIALLEQPVFICGTGSLLTRPLNMIADALQQFGAKISSEQGKLPLSIQGKMRGGTAHIDGSSGSQLLTGLLMALPLADDDSTIYVQQLSSKPYIDLTINLLSHFGIVIAHENYEVFHIQGGQRYQPCTYNIEGDWSGASCLLVAGCIAGKVSVSNLDVRSRQADTAIVDAIKKAGGEVEIKNDTSLQTVTTTQSPLHAFEFDATNCPDLFPALTALAACSQGITKISGVHRLVHKESNRAETLQQEFAKIGIHIAIHDDAMFTTGGTISGATVCAHNDHRIAMALATAALTTTSPVIIEEAECVAKSYPQFWDDFQGLLA